MKIEVEDIMDNITEIIDKMYKEMHMISVFKVLNILKYALYLYIHL